jgi:hypothetical protein
MARVFACLAISEILLVIGAAILGFLRGAGSVDRHMLLGLFVLLLASLIQIVVFTYLSVTGKMIAQAVHLGDLGLEPLLEARNIKRSVTHLLAAGMAPVVFLAVTAGLHWRSGEHATLHFLAGSVMLAVHVGVFVAQHRRIAANGILLDRTLREYSVGRANASRCQPDEDPRESGREADACKNRRKG